MIMIQHLNAQIDTITLKHKFILGINAQYFGINVRNTEYFEYIVGLHLRGGYFFAPKLLTMVEMHGWYRRSNLINQLEQQRIWSISPGVRYYFARSNRFFIESGIQYGKVICNNLSSDSFRFFQAGIGGGINLLLYQGFAGGRFMFEAVLRHNFNLAERQDYGIIDSHLKFLGNSFGINYLFPAAQAATQINRLPIEPIRNLHSVQFSFPNTIAYSYEIPLRNTLTLGTELSVVELLGMFDDDMSFIPRITIELRNYYGYYRRQQRGQVTNNLSSDFLSFAVACTMVYAENADEQLWQFGFGPRWGFRRAMGSRLFFEATFGASLVKETYHNWGIMPHMSSWLGFAF